MQTCLRLPSNSGSAGIEGWIWVRTFS
jgi:hypothetical protein